MATGVDTQSLQAVRNKYIGQVANRCVIPNAFTSASKQQMSRSGHLARDRLSKPQIVIPNYYLDYTGGVAAELNSGAASAVTASIEYPLGVYTPATFAGASSGSVAAGASITTDQLPISVPKGKMFWVRIWMSNPNGITYSFATGPKNNAIFGDGMVFGATTPDLTMGGVVESGGASSTMFSPVAIISETRAPSFLYLGDSRCWGQADTVDASGDVGLMRPISGAYGYINCGRQSDKLQYLVSSGAIRMSLGQFVSDIAVQQDINDLASARTAAQVQTDHTSVGNLLRAMYPNKRLWITTTYPQTDASNTTPNASSNANRILVNNWKRKVPAPFDGCIEIADAVESARDSGLFASSTYTADGTHMLQAGTLAIGTSGFVDTAMFRF